MPGQENQWIAGTADFVRGTIIGPITVPYEFWIVDEIAGQPFDRRLDRGFFEDDDQAEAWVKEHYPAEYAKGIEMRVFDQ